MPPTLQNTPNGRVGEFYVLTLPIDVEIAGGATATFQTQLDSLYDELEVRYLNGVIHTSQVELTSTLALTALPYGSGGTQSPGTTGNTLPGLNAVVGNFTTGNRQWFSAATPLNLIMGDGIHPFPLPVPKRIRGGTTVSGTFTNNTANIEIKGYISFVGIGWRA